MFKLLLVFIVSLTDILTKYWAHTSDPQFSIIGNFVGIHHVKNTGVAFGTALPGITWIIPLILIGLGITLWTGWRKISEKEKTGYLLIGTGGLLNAIERTLFGSVTDFINVQYFSVFNIADIAITAGVIVLLVSYFSGRKK